MKFTARGDAGREVSGIEAKNLERKKVGGKQEQVMSWECWQDLNKQMTRGEEGNIRGGAERTTAEDYPGRKKRSGGGEGRGSAKDRKERE